MVAYRRLWLHCNYSVNAEFYSFPFYPQIFFQTFFRFEEKERPYRCSVTSKNIRRYSSKECKVLVEQGKEHLRQMKENHGQSKVSTAYCV